MHQSLKRVFLDMDGLVGCLRLRFELLIKGALASHQSLHHWFEVGAVQLIDVFLAVENLRDTLAIVLFEEEQEKQEGEGCCKTLHNVQDIRCVIFEAV